MLQRLVSSLHRFAEAVAAALLAVIFIAFILQIALRYVFNAPVGWTSELSVAAWLWLVLWGAAFVLKDHEEIRFDLVADRVGPRARRVLAAVGAVAVIVLFGMALPASYAYVTFMKVEKSAYMGVRMDVMYMVFAVAVIIRSVRVLARVARGAEPRASDPASTYSAL
jgi:TRAP-type C4-dicarboxylate transport system permease small subunit